MISTLKQAVARTPLIAPMARRLRDAMQSADFSLGRRVYADEDSLSQTLTWPSAEPVTRRIPRGPKTTE